MKFKILLASILALVFSASLIFGQAQQQQQPPPPEKVVISYQLVNAIAAYLRKQPFEEVDILLKAIQNGLSTVPEVPEVPKEAKKDEKKGDGKEQVVLKKEEAPPKAEAGK